MTDGFLFSEKPRDRWSYMHVQERPLCLQEQGPARVWERK